MTAPAYLSRPGAPPHHQGQLAAWHGLPIEANPHEAEAVTRPEDYPGAHVEWRWGWQHARAVIAQTKESRP